MTDSVDSSFIMCNFHLGWLLVHYWTAPIQSVCMLNECKLFIAVTLFLCAYFNARIMMCVFSKCSVKIGVSCHLKFVWNGVKISFIVLQEIDFWMVMKLPSWTCCLYRSICEILYKMLVAAVPSCIVLIPFGI